MSIRAETMISDVNLPAGALVAAAGVGALGIAAYAFTISTPPGRKPLSAIPGPPGKLLTGHLHVLQTPDVHRTLTQYAVEYGPIYRISLLGTTIVVVSDAATSLALCDTLPKYKPAYDASNQLGTKQRQPGLFSAPHAESFNYVRKGVLPAFNSAQLNKNFPRLKTHAMRLVEHIKGLAAKAPAGAEVNFLDGIMASVFDAAADVLFNVQFNSLVNPLENQALKSLLRGRLEISARVTDPLREQLQMLLWFTPANQQIFKMFDELYTVLYHRIIDDLKARSPLPEDDLSVGACLMRLIDPKTGKRPDDVTLQANISALLIGGMETTVSGSQWVLYDLARQPDVMAGVEKELQEAGLLTKDGKPGRPLEYSDLTRLQYFNAVFKESLRVHNIVGCTATFRVADRPLEVLGYHVPKGTPMWIPLHSATNSPVNFPSPHEFRPERWLGATGPDGKTPNPWHSTQDWHGLIFSHGPRSCPGMPHGLVQLKTFLLVLLTQLRLSLGPSLSDPADVEASQVMALTMISTKGFPYVVSPR